MVAHITVEAYKGGYEEEKEGVAGVAEGVGLALPMCVGSVTLAGLNGN